MRYGIECPGIRDDTYKYATLQSLRSVMMWQTFWPFPNGFWLFCKLIPIIYGVIPRLLCLLVNLAGLRVIFSSNMLMCKYSLDAVTLYHLSLR